MFLFNAAGESLRTLTGSDAPLTAIAMSPNDGMVAAGNESGTINFWNTDEGKLGLALSGHTGAVLDIDFHPRQEQFVSAGADGTIRIWDIPSPVRPCRGHSDIVRTVTVGADGTTVATASNDKTVRLWNLAEDPAKPDQPADEVLRIEHSEAATAIALSPDGKQVASADSTGTLRLFDRASGKPQSVPWGP